MCHSYTDNIDNTLQIAVSPDGCIMQGQQLHTNAPAAIEVLCYNGIPTLPKVYQTPSISHWLNCQHESIEIY